MLYYLDLVKTLFLISTSMYVGLDNDDVDEYSYLVDIC